MFERVWNASLVVCLAFLATCGSDSPSNSIGDIKIVLKSSDIARRETSSRTCTVTVDGVPETGNCFTPVAVNGYYTSGGLANTTGGLPVRLVGGGSTLSGLDSVFERHAFDLSTFPTVQGEDNIQDGNAESYNLLTLQLASLETVYVGTASNKYYHVRAFFVDQPPSAGSVFAACGLSSSLLGEMDLASVLYTGSTARRGDLMMCIKNNATDVCAASDYQWVDGLGTLTSVRPMSPPKMLAGAYVTSADTCDASGAQPSLSWGGLNLTMGIPTPVSVSAAFADGKKTYTVKNGATIETGTTLTVTADVDLTDSLFASSASSVTDLATESEADLIEQITEIQLKPIYVENMKSTASTADGAQLSADVTLSVQ